jgi:hypothetical protein
MIRQVVQMASIWKDARNGTYLIKFHYDGRRYTRSCQTEKESDASRLKALVEGTLIDDSSSSRAHGKERTDNASTGWIDSTPVPACPGPPSRNGLVTEDSLPQGWPRRIRQAAPRLVTARVYRAIRGGETEQSRDAGNHPARRPRVRSGKDPEKMYR